MIRTFCLREDTTLATPLVSSTLFFFFCLHEAIVSSLPYSHSHLGFVGFLVSVQQDLQWRHAEQESGMHRRDKL